MESSWFDSFKI